MRNLRRKSISIRTKSRCFELLFFLCDQGIVCERLERWTCGTVKNCQAKIYHLGSFYTRTCLAYNLKRFLFLINLNKILCPWAKKISQLSGSSLKTLAEFVPLGHTPIPFNLQSGVLLPLFFVWGEQKGPLRPRPPTFSLPKKKERLMAGYVPVSTNYQFTYAYEVS